jgi:hypothetical protein
MLNQLNCVSVGARLPYFVTATLPDELFDDDVGRFAKTAKRLLDTFLKRVFRVTMVRTEHGARVAESPAAGFWRIEWQARKSGQHIGKLFPHFHLLLWGLPERRLPDREKRDHCGFVESVEEVWEAYVELEDSQLSLELVTELSHRPQKETDKVCVTTLGELGRFTFAGSWKYVNRCRNLLDWLSLEKFSSFPEVAERARKMAFQDWASLAWYHVVDSHNLDHLAAGLRVERVRSWGGVMSYAAKYMTKQDCGFLSEVQFGRSWGVFNRAAIPWAKIIELDLEPEIGVRLRRVARRYLESRRGHRVNASYGITLYCDVENVKKLWQRREPDPF